MAKKNNKPATETTDAVPKASEVPSREQLGKMLARYRVTIEARLAFAHVAPGNDELRKALELVDAAEDALPHTQSSHADIRQLVGLVQGILYALGVHRWDYIASDDER